MALNRRPTNQTIKEATPLLSKQEKTITLQWVLSRIGVNKSKAADHLGKKDKYNSARKGREDHTTLRQSEGSSKEILQEFQHKQWKEIESYKRIKTKTYKTPDDRTL